MAMLCPYVLHYPEPPPPQPVNPTTAQRNEMARYAFKRVCRPEDFPYVARVLSPPPDITTKAPAGSSQGKRVGIIGGGLAGMAAAFELRKLGFDITVFDALEDRVGGRVYTYYFDPEKTLYGEFGPMRIPVSHETVWHYINLFKLPTRPFIQTNPNAWIYLHGVRARNDPWGANVMRSIYPTYQLAEGERHIPWQVLGYHGLEAPLLEADPSVRSEIAQVKPCYHPQTLAWDAVNTRQMMESKGLSNEAINMLSNLFPLAGELLYNNYIDFVQEYYPANFTFMYEISGGLAKLPLAFYHSFTCLDPGVYYPGIPSDLLGTVTWKAGHRVDAIHQVSAGEKVLLGGMQKSSGRCWYEAFDYVVCAIPYSTLRNIQIRPLFSSIKMQAIKEVTYVAAQKTAMLCRERFWEAQGIYGGGSYTDLPVTTLWYPSDHAEKEPAGTQSVPSIRQKGSMPLWKEPGVMLSSYNFNLNAVRLGNRTAEPRFEEMEREVEQVHGLPPASLNPVVAGFKTQQWDRDPDFRGAFCFFSPEQKRIFSYPMTLPEYGNRLFFAGEHISALHRWMQGALQSGMDAANALAACRRRS